MISLNSANRHLQRLAHEKLLEETRNTKLVGTNMVITASFDTDTFNASGSNAVIHSKKHYYPRIKLMYLKHLYTRVKDSNKYSFDIISSLYSLGLGVPVRDDYSLAWKKHANMVCPDNGLGFERCKKRFLIDVKNAIKNSKDGEYAYSEAHLNAYKAAKYMFGIKSVDTQTIRKELVKARKEGHIKSAKAVTVTPLVSGQQALCIYKSVPSGLKLFEILTQVGGEIVSLLDKVYELEPDSIPLTMSKNNAETYVKNMLELTGKEHPFFIVYGTLTVPISKRESLKKFIPNATSVKKLIAMMRAHSKRPVHKPKEEDAVTKEQYKARVKLYEKELRKVARENPFSYLQFVASNIYGFDNKSSINSIPIPVVYREAHLSSSGFRTIIHMLDSKITRINYGSYIFQEENIKKEFVKIKKLFRDYKIGGLLIEPNEHNDIVNYIPRLVYLDGSNSTVKNQATKPPSR